MNQFISVNDVPNLDKLVQEALECKANPFGVKHVGQHKTIALLFFNPSLRTRLSTQKAAINLGMSVMSMDMTKGWKLEFEENIIMNGQSAEHIKEGAAVISQYADVIGVRLFPTLTDRAKDYAENWLSKFTKYASVPVISLESATRHPLQSLTDLMTIREFQKTEKPKVVLTWAPHPKALPQAVPNSFAEWMIAADMDFTITHPKGYELSKEFIGNTKIEYNQDKALADADFVYAKNWSSYEDYGKVLSTDESWMITKDKMALTNNGYFMHCLPVRRNVVVSGAVLDSPNSLAIHQANNRTFAAQAVLKACLNLP